MAVTVRAETARAATHRQATHVLICGAADPALDIALHLRRLGEAVTLLADDLRAEPRQTLERAGVRVIIGPPRDPRALAEARADEARAAIVAAPGDLSCIETLLGIQSMYPALPLVCCVNDMELAARAERSLGARMAVCTSAIEAVHLAGCSLGPDVIGAFPIGDDLVLLRRVTSPSKGARVLMVEEKDGRRVIGPSAAMPISADATLTVVERMSAHASPQTLRTFTNAARTIRGNTPPALAWTALVLTLLAAASVFVFMAGMNIPFSDAAYLVLNTISTVGYGDITPFGWGGWMHFFGSFVALLGPALLGTLLLIFARAVLRPQRDVPPSRGHVVIAAAPAVAAAAVAQLRRISVDAVAVSHDLPVETLLRETNAAHARALVAATHDPVKNVTLGLAAREINPSIHIVAAAPAGIHMTTPASAPAASVSIAASAALVDGLRYAITIGDRVFSFFEGPAGEDWSGRRPSDVSGAYNFITLFRDHDDVFDENETVLVAAWRRMER